MKMKSKTAKLTTHGKKKKDGNAAHKQEKKAMTVDDMFTMIEDDTDADAKTLTTKAAKKSSGEKKTGKASAEVIETGANGFEGYDFEGEENEDDETDVTSNLSREEYLEKLKKSDPEFYSTMMQSSELMGLESSDEEGDEDSTKSDDSEGPDSEEEDDDAEISQEEDGEENDVEVSNTNNSLRGNVTKQMIAEWEEELRGPKPLTAFLEVQQAFLAAVESLGHGMNEPRNSRCKYTVKGSQSFNDVVRLCLRNMAPALQTIFQLKDAKHQPTKSKKWNKYKSSIKLYLRKLISLTEAVAEPSVAEAVLRSGVLPLIPFYAAYPAMSKLLARRLITLWSTSDKKVRVLAFMAIFRLTQTLHGEFLEWMLKKMYIAYVQNCHFTSPGTWGCIDFMRVSLVELYSLDYTHAYRHAFVYIRQMAIHLRNAILHPQKERVQLVYNWQYIHCLNLWCDLLGKTHPNPTLQPMLFPVTQVAIGTLKLQPTPTFFPLAFHICRMLTELSRNTGTFIPVLPFYLEILNKAIFFKQPKKSSLRPFKWMCMLRLSRSELKESAFKDGVVDQVYDGIVCYLSVVSSSISFPDFVVPLVLQIKAFIKKCKSPSYCKKFKQLQDKIRENSEFVEDRRKTVKFGIADSKAVKDWEISLKQTGTPLSKYYETLRKIREKEHADLNADSVSVPDYDLPSVKKRQLDERRRGNIPEGILTSDEEEEEEEEEEDIPTDARLESNKKQRKTIEDGPPTKKAKTEEEVITDLKDIHRGAVDVLKQLDFSDNEVEDDEYGISSDSDS